MVLPRVRILPRSRDILMLIPWRSLILAFVAYFALGAYHNYSTYGATGKDLIPYVIRMCRLGIATHITAGIVISGKKCRICWAMSSRICALLFGLVVHRVEADTLQYRPSRYVFPICFDKYGI